MSKQQALALKDQGNAFLKEHKYQEAVDAYTKAIELDALNPIFYLNRAQVHIKMESYGLAINDCNLALDVDPNFVKAYYRKGVSLMALLNYKEAQTNFKQILKKVPGDKATQENLKQCVNYLKKEAFERAIAGNEKTLVIYNVDYDGMLVEKSWTGPELEISQLKNENGEVSVLLAVCSTRAPILARSCWKKARKVTVVGDTHGQFYDVLNLFQKFGHVSPEHVYLFNGDFVDRGSWSCEVALYLYVLKVIYPKSIFINRGNHETNDMNKTYGFTDECEAKYSRKVFEAFAESFGALPLATLINQLYLVMHGGLFSNDKVTLDDIRKINRFPSSGSSQPAREGLAMELLWTDPQPENGRSPSKRGLGIQFGPDITERFCLSNKIRKVLRSHEVRMGGVESEHNGRLITVFSAPNYCDSTGNLGGVVHITENKDYDGKKDDGEGYRLAEDPNCPWTLATETFAAVPHPDLKPMAYSKSGFGF
ncbi:hypothetical protein HF325_003929 [Metschnikowia pulcherrima]|uniref:Serine/threonine-protein phosphatase n=1 Tax=Metschnikowia pulcherrima TaxID=27326 RepID=A0A8H7GQE1_9ASCO|nr:hypothetical protein HF325_003929 [Metschnikowia pulcherrima]